MMVNLELEMKELDYLQQLLAQRPIAEALGVYLKVVQARRIPQDNPPTPPTGDHDGRTL